MILLVIGLVVLGGAVGDKPNIIVIIGDDMGFNDVSFHGSDEIPTPNIDALAYNGVILNSHYTQALCTPSRASFLTGKYPIHLGMQHLVILEPEPWGLPLNETILPQYLKKNGYVTRAVGKWHLGFAHKEYTPTYRGFDSHYGYWQGYQDYWNHSVHASYTTELGYDFRRNMSVDWDAHGKYTTTLLTDEAVNLIQSHDVSNPLFMYLAHLAPHSGNDWEPLQAPDEEIAKFAHIEDPERRVYAAMVSLLDKSVGSVIQALRQRRMLDNSIIIFMSDNGAAPEGIHANHGSNYPLRGAKSSAWDGGMRNIAAIWSPLIKHPKRVSNNLMHISDWLPTLYSAAGLDKSQLPNIDGVDQWEAISTSKPSPRTEILHNIDDIWAFGGIRQGDWKYVYGSGSKGRMDGWYGNNGKQPQYHYDPDEVLRSPVGYALSGLATFTQIKQKNLHQNYTMLLTKQDIVSLRAKATVTCPVLKAEQQLETHKCLPMNSPCLFNIKDDPCEQVNLAAERPLILHNLEKALWGYKLTARKPINVDRDPRADPDLYNGTWTNWLDLDDVTSQETYNHLSSLTVGLISGACVAVAIIIIILLGISCQKTKGSLRSLYEGKDDGEVEEKCTGFEQRERQLRTSLKDEFREV